MKQIFCITCLFALLLSACSVKVPTAALPTESFSYRTYQLIFQTKELSNDCVGNNWSFTYTYDGQIIKSGDTINFPLEAFSFLSIGVEVRENDKADDVSNGTLAVAMYDGGLGKTNVTVTETNGRYKGNTAVWEITCAVQPVG